jgi:hypothetical protein
LFSTDLNSKVTNNVKFSSETATKMM